MFVLKKEDQDKNWELAINKYAYPLVQYAKENNRKLYLEYNKDRDFKTAMDIYTSGEISLEQFHRPKEFKHYSKFKKEKGERWYNVGDSEMYFTVTNIDPEVSTNNCRTCNEMNYRSFMFYGQLFNTGIKGNKPVPYYGQIKLGYGCYHCKCKGGITDRICKTYENCPKYYFRINVDNIDNKPFCYMPFDNLVSFNLFWC